jgi:hypothetical protein
MRRLSFTKKRQNRPLVDEIPFTNVNNKYAITMFNEDYLAALIKNYQKDGGKHKRHKYCF